MEQGNFSIELVTKSTRYQCLQRPLVNGYQTAFIPSLLFGMAGVVFHMQLRDYMSIFWKMSHIQITSDQY